MNSTQLQLDGTRQGLSSRGNTLNLASFAVGEKSQTWLMLPNPPIPLIHLLVSSQGCLDLQGYSNYQWVTGVWSSCMSSHAVGEIWGFLTHKRGRFWLWSWWHSPTTWPKPWKWCVYFWFILNMFRSFNATIWEGKSCLTIWHNYLLLALEPIPKKQSLMWLVSSVVTGQLLSVRVGNLMHLTILEFN